MSRGTRHYPRLSPDGRKVAVEILEPGNSGIWIFDIEVRTLARVTATGQGENQRPLWPSDGRRVIFGSNRSGTWDTWWAPVDGSGGAELLQPQGSSGFLAFWASDVSPDDQYLLGGGIIDDRPDDGMTSEILYSPVDDPTVVHLLVPRHEGVEKFVPTLSPTGNLAAYVSEETGPRTVYATPFPGPGERRPVSVGGDANFPIWSSDGMRLFYLQGGQIVVRDVVDEESLEFSPPRELFRINTPGSGNYTIRDYDLAPDGESFVKLVRIDEAEPLTHINVVLNVLDQLERLLPTDGSQ